MWQERVEAEGTPVTQGTLPAQAAVASSLGNVGATGVLVSLDRELAPTVVMVAARQGDSSVR